MEVLGKVHYFGKISTAELLAAPYYGIFPVISEFWENAQYSLRIYCFLGKYSVFILQGVNYQLICKLYSTVDTYVGK